MYVFAPEARLHASFERLLFIWGLEYREGLLRKMAWNERVEGFYFNGVCVKGSGERGYTADVG